MEQKAVEMISLCNADGKVVPLRFRVRNENEEYVRIDVDEVISTKHTPYVGVECFTYLCRASEGKRRMLVELKYYIRQHTWFVLGQYQKWTGNEAADHV